MTSDPAHRARCNRAAGFSLLEVMIAVVLLGLGLVLVATMFPVAWTRARDLNEYTIQRNVTEGASSFIPSVVRVNAPDTAWSGFAGDLIRDGIGTRGDLAVPDSRVHALHLENIKIEGRSFVLEAPGLLECPPGSTCSLLVDDINELCKQLDDLDATDVTYDTCQNIILDPASAVSDDPDECWATYQCPRVRFHQRLEPPLPARTDPLLTNPEPAWDDALDSRSYAWAAFHRLRQASSLTDSGQTRTFDLYLVTLRRPQPSLRYARQDPATAPDPGELLPQPEFTPAALPIDEDVLLPVAWRVQVGLQDANGSLLGIQPRATASGIPTEIRVPPDGADTGAELTIDFFAPGAVMVDELNGQVYRVENRRLTENPAVAFLTLDREIVLEDVDIDPAYGPCGGACVPSVFDPEEALRTVWVFPPPVTRSEDGDAFFEGRTPVVGIDVRTVNIAP